MVNKLNIKVFNTKGKKYNKSYIIYIIKKNCIKLGHTNYFLDVFTNNKYLLNKTFKISNNISKHSRNNVLYKKYFL